MFPSNLNIYKNYFYMPFGPVILKLNEIGLRKIPFSRNFIKVSDGSQWRQKLLFNTGWGQPIGYERLPFLHFEDLITLALLSDYRNTKLSVQEEESNKYGAISVIMEEHITEFINFIAYYLDFEGFYRNTLYKENLRLFCLDENKADGNGGIKGKSYEQILKGHLAWNNLSLKAKSLIYTD